MTTKDTTPMNFDDLTPIEIPVSIGVKQYVLCEATGTAGVAFNNARTKGIKFSNEGKPNSISGVADVEPLLVSLCLFETVEGGRKPVPITTVQSWPYRVMKDLFDRAKEISNLDESETLEDLQKQKTEIDKKIADFEKDAVKNLPSDTTDGSD